MSSPLPACLYSVTLLIKRKDGKVSAFGGINTAASEAEALGATMMEWQAEHSAEYPDVIGFVVVPADYDQLAYIVAQCESDEG